MEVAALVIGILPLALEALKSFRSIRGKIKTFRHASKEAKRIHTQLKVKRRTFANACISLLRCVMDDEDERRGMTHDLSDSRWTDPSMERRIEGQLSDNYAGCRDVVEDIRATFSEIDEKMESLFENGQIKKVKLAFRRGSYEKYIGSLRNANSDLRVLISDALEIGAGHFDLPTKYLYRRPRGRPDFNTAQKAAKELGDVLITTWQCADIDHTNHYARLCLDVPDRWTEFKNAEIVQSMFLCYEKVENESIIQSITVKSSLADDKSRIPEPLLPTPPTSNPPFVPSSTFTQDDNRSAKRRKIRLFDSPSSSSYPPSHQQRPVTPPQGCLHGLRTELCQSLTSLICCENRGEPAWCTVSIASQRGNFNHTFQSLSGPHDDSVISGGSRKPTSLLDIVKLPLVETISTTDQYKLARRLVCGVLAYHSTDWLAELWGLDDVSFFTGGEDVYNNNFSSLHFFKRLTQRPNTPQSPDETMLDNASNKPNDNSKSEPTDDERFLYGIRNVSLYSLGVVMLEIGHWRELDVRDIVSIRKLAHPSSLRHPLGPRYHELARKCVDCDFGLGSDLTTEKLQSAVYDQIVAGLDTIIAAIDLDA